MYKWYARIHYVRHTYKVLNMTFYYDAITISIIKQFLWQLYHNIF